MKPQSRIVVILELSPERAAALKRFAEKVAYSDAMAVLYSHVSADIRSAQASEIIAGFADLDRELTKTGVTTHPWIQTGQCGGVSSK